MFKTIFLATLLVLSGAQLAFAQGLPPEVADPYRAYTQASEAGDMDAARAHARDAWQAADRLNFDPETTSVLADNYAQLSLRARDFDEAVRAFKRTAELLDQIEAEAFVRSETWMLAAHAALSSGDNREARRCADTAGDLAENARDMDPDARATLLFNSRAIQASSHWGEGQIMMAFRRAEEAMDSAGDRDFSGSPYFPLLSFVLGASHALVRDNEEAAYWLTVAYHHIPERRTALGFWSDYARANLDEDQRLDLLERLAATTLPDLPREPDEVVRNREEFAALQAQEGFVREVPATRTSPNYPRDAAAAGIEGVALIQFTVTEDGEVTDEEVLLSIPVREFGEAGIREVRRWTYQPATLNGEPIERRNALIEFRFTLAD